MNKYFGTYNNIRLDNPEENINYDPSTLRNALMYRDANTIAVDYINAYFNNEPFVMSMIPSGFGSLIYALLDKTLVSKIYIRAPKRQKDIILNNIKAYGLNKKRLSFTRSLNKDDSSLFYADLLDSPSFNLKELLDEKFFPLYIFRVPKNWQLQEYPDYSCTLEELKDTSSNLLICHLDEMESDELSDVDPVYLQNLIVYLDGLLARIIPEGRDAYFSPDVLPIWVQAFTHKTVDPNINYDVLEMIGDRAMKLGFADYVIQKIEGVNERQLSELQNYYLSKIQQHQLAKQLGMGEYIRKLGELSVSVLEDVTESFFGALFRVSEEVSGGLGYYNVFRMIASLYGEMDLEKQLKIVQRGSDKSVVNQNMERLHIPIPKEIHFKEGSVNRIILTLPQQSVNFFRQLGIIIPNEIANATGNTKKSASTNAYTMARKFLASKGITDEWVDQQSEVIAFNDPAFIPYLPTVRQKLQDEGYTGMKFSLAHRTATECIIQLLGILPNGTLRILATSNNCDQQEAKVDVLRAYAGS